VEWAQRGALNLIEWRKIRGQQIPIHIGWNLSGVAIGVCFPDRACLYVVLAKPLYIRRAGGYRRVGVQVPERVPGTRWGLDLPHDYAIAMLRFS